MLSPFLFFLLTSYCVFLPQGLLSELHPPFSCRESFLLQWGPVMFPFLPPVALQSQHRTAKNPAWIWCLCCVSMPNRNIQKHAILRHSRKPSPWGQVEVSMDPHASIQFPHYACPVCTSFPFLWQRVPIWLPGKQAFFHAVFKHVRRVGWLCFTLRWRIHPMHV